MAVPPDRPSECYWRSPTVLSRRLADRLLLLSTVGGEVVTLSGSGIALWDALARPRNVSALADELAEHFDADALSVRRDIEPVLVDLAARNLVVAGD